MRSTAIFAAILGASISVSARILPRTPPECEDKPGAPYGPIGGGVSSPHGGGGGSGSTPVSPDVPMGAGTYGPPPGSYGASAEDPYGGGSSSGNVNSTLTCGATRIASYTVVGGDTLTSIADQFSSGICDIVELNGIENPNFISTGQTLQIPVECREPDNDSCLPPPAPPITETCVPGVGSTYTVVSGDTLTLISQDFNITLDSLIAANPQISNPDAIDVGQVINIPICPDSQCESVGTYTIQAGDLFVDLAVAYHVLVGQIKSLNANVDPTKTQPGDIIILPQGCHNVTTYIA